MTSLPPLQHMECEGKEDAGVCNPGDAPKYPYGLCVRLCSEDLQKLDLSEDCDVGDEICFVACAKVTSVMKRETKDGSDCGIELQITDMGIVSMEDEPEPMMSRQERASTLYDHKEEY